MRIHVAGILVLNWTAAISTVHQEDMGDAKDDNNTQQRKENRLASLRMLILFGKLGSTNDLFKTALGVLKSVNCKPRHALDVIILTIGNLCKICKEKRWLAFVLWALPYANLAKHGISNSIELCSAAEMSVGRSSTSAEEPTEEQPHH